ncbi:Folylpolyglutamate synthase [Dyadobacter sp. CECT 9275]|uniref:Dihydrofolate synthase/folylpolyglutamate synthase n=1 Tax=Dyadobacter helix TaxID=2822344 RepID=A0A916JAY0_9BACT|nr:folylpolyglutamate synthase/dihydrofolate synthase family protein [Dyadobacter sp. CECT 9275]CAG4997596.1 Folylpolyglutamate synthase [Dyadobacter sp. CECT 9275]
MDYQEAIDYLFSRLPVFQNIGARAYKPGLETTREICGILGNPQNNYPTIHVGGTNGKGSTSHMLAAILQTAGYKVGLYTSPHLKSFTERIRVNGIPINESYVATFVTVNKSYIDNLSPSFFELTVAMAFSYFSDQQVDVAIIEVGMGGRLDSTNIIKPVVSVITNVSFDHVQFLGDTLPKIAAEKAGIIKDNVPVVISEYQNEEVASVFEAAARQHEAPLYYGSQVYRVMETEHSEGFMALTAKCIDKKEVRFDHLRLDLTGNYQAKNICGVLTAVDVIRTAGFEIGDEHISSALPNVSRLTGLKGRWQRIGESPLVYCDTAHNYAGLGATIPQFESIEATAHRYVLGFVADKDISGILDLFPSTGVYYFCEPGNLRALPSENLQQAALRSGLQGRVYKDVNQALAAAKADSISTDCIYVGGSTFVVAELTDL